MPTNPRIALIVASGNPELFREWLTRSYPSLKTAQIVVVPWGQDGQAVRELIPGGVTVCEPAEDTTLEANRNIALTYLSKSPPNLVGFIDDDAFVGKNWLSAMSAAAQARPDAAAFASVVRSDGGNFVQARGHLFHNGAPHDRGHNNKAARSDPLCPCGNACIVRWTAIEKIAEIEPTIWDPKFRQWQTCFDFGLKLILTGSRTVEVAEATAEHRGYMAWTLNERKLKADRAIEGQLRSRFLLYHKFFPDDLRARAISHLKSRLEERWHIQGYPGFRFVRSERLVRLIGSAWQSADHLAAKYTDAWRVLMERRIDAHKLAGFETINEAG